MSHTTRSGRIWLRRIAVSFFVCLGLTPAARAQQQHSMPILPPPAQAPIALSQPAQEKTYSLNDCVLIGLGSQPAIAAQRASLASAEAQRQALDHMVLASLVSHELGFRKRQACLGVTISQAGVDIAEWETIYAVTRCYYSVIYARQQEVLARGLMEKLELSRKSAQALVKKADPDNPVTQVDVDKLTVNLELLELRLIEASTGVNRATAALKEAMGLRYDTPLALPLVTLPSTSDIVDRDVVIQMAMSRRGELLQATLASQLTELEICAQNSGCCLLPFRKTFAAASDIHAKPIPQGTSNGTYRPSAIGIEMPSTLVGNKSDRVARAMELNTRAGSVVEKTQNLIALEVEDAFYKWQAATGQVKTLRESAAKSAKLAALISGRFESGKVSGEDYLRARTLEDQTQAQLNEAIYHQILALAALERVTAGGFTPSFRRSQQ
ncbi:MAG TPA: TolC family protein [Gemmataceae bacterium]|nr:TolC family protein [Gemmataceae bacterium]